MKIQTKDISQAEFGRKEISTETECGLMALVKSTMETLQRSKNFRLSTYDYSNCPN